MRTPDYTASQPPKLALSRNEAAAALGVSAVTVDRLTKRGLLHPSRATRRPIYPVKELERFLRETSPIDYDAPRERFAMLGGRASAQASNTEDRV